MKTKICYKIFISLLFFTSISLLKSYSQGECDDEFFTGYDFRSQSVYGELSPGDTMKLNVVVYAGQDFRVFVCNDTELGDLTYRLFKRERVTKKIIKDILEVEEVKYQLDENGDIAYPEENNYEPVVISKKIVNDTIWTNKRVFEDFLVFDNKKNASKPYWEESVSKTHRLVINVIVPKGDPNYLGFVEIYVGRRSKKSGKFDRFQDKVN